MRLQREREQIVEFSQRMTPDDLTVGTSGNVSIRSGDLVVVTPSGVEYEDLTPELICVIDPAGGMVEGELGPTSEVPMHTSVYRETDWQAVVHTHPSYATALSVLVDELPAVHYMIALLGGPVRVAPYATYGTPELAKNALRGLQDRSAVLLANHGASTVGETLDKAYTRSVYLEWICKLYYQARLLGDPALLSEEEIAHVADKLQTYGQAPPADDG
ncbi:MAG: class II aldolase/adducin family protein [Actinomycetota bacterium]|nr:class II aldolase/adducin family protein [Actinomycetota bacterium]